MSKNKRIPKTLSQKLDDLDAHLFIVRDHLSKLNESSSHLKILSAELRTLVCQSSWAEGLLWRLVDELKIDDRIFLHVPGDLIEDHPLVQGLQFMIVPIKRGGQGDPQLTPGYYSFKDIIEETQALVACGKPFKHEYLIKAVAQQMGTAHEDEGLEEMLVNLKSIFLNGVEPYVPILATNAELTLEIGERVLEAAEKRLDYKRHHHKHDYGNLSIVASLGIKQAIVEDVLLFTFRSYVSDTTISLYATSSGIKFTILKNNVLAGELIAKFSSDHIEGKHLVVVFSYCSLTKQARTIIEGVASGLSSFKDIGWLHASDFSLEDINKSDTDFIEKYYILTFERLMSSKDSSELSEMPANGYGIWKHSDELVERGEFPE
jgi:hypothetical protein